MSRDPTSMNTDTDTDTDTDNKEHPSLTPEYPSLRGRVVIVTGGGRGLGREMALALAAAGANVMATAANSADELATLEKSFQDDASVNSGTDYGANTRTDTGAQKGEIQTIVADTATYSDCEKVVDATIQAFGTVHCLVNNAGRGMRLVSETFTTEPCLFWNTDPSDWQTIINCNINGPFNMVRAVTPQLIQQKFGKIINVSTSLQTMTRTGYSPYGPSKAALEAASLIWASDLKDTGVTVNVLLPGGATDTALLPDMVNKRGADGNLLSPALMRAPILWLCADDSNGHTAERYIAKQWLPTSDSAAAALAARDDSGELPRIM